MRWTAQPHSANSGAWFVTDENGICVAAGLTPEHARLFAAAPEMRDILQRVLDACNNNTHEGLPYVLYREVQQHGAHVLHTLTGDPRRI